MTLPLPVHDFVQSIPLPDTITAPHTASACVAGHSLVSFQGEISRQNREDVLNSSLLMQLSADHQFGKAGQSQAWYDCYTSGMARLGWNLTSSSLQEYGASHQAFSLDQEVMDIIGLMAGGSAIAPLVRKTLDSLQKDQDARSLFDNNRQHTHDGSFLIQPCVQNPQGDVTMMLNCIQFSCDRAKTDILFARFHRSEVKIFCAAQRAMLDTQVYSDVREAVLNKLEGNANAFVRSLVL